MQFSPLPDDMDPAIRRWTIELQKLAAVSGYSSMRKLAEKLPFETSTVHRYITGKRVNDDSWEVALAIIAIAREKCMKVPVDLQALRATYEEAVAAYQRQPSKNGETPTDNEASQQDPAHTETGHIQHDEPKSDTLSREGRFRRRKLAYTIGASVLALSLFYSATAYFADWWPFEPKVWHVKVVDTYSATYNYALGLHRYRNPDVPGDKDNDFFYPEGSTVPIVCQDRHRRLIVDPTTKKSSPVWNKTLDGWWVSDLYTDSPKVPGDTPPLGIPTC